MRNKNVLVTGGAGYIGSHMVRKLLEKQYNPIVFDNLSTGHREFVPKNVLFFQGDLQQQEDIKRVLEIYPIDTVMHFAASALVSESMFNPIKYYRNNVFSCINLLDAMLNSGTNRIILSSTCAIYGEPKTIPITEDQETRPTNPYGRSKLMNETILQDLANTSDLSYISLRYFNVAGAHPSGEIGEWHEPETHLIPNILRVALEKEQELEVYGNSYQTIDGTCIRDYIHVEDLCEAHLLALEALKKGKKKNSFNLGSGHGYSIKEVIDAAIAVTGEKIKFKFCPPRPGDPAKLVASFSKAEHTLDWKPKKSLEEIIESSWRWAKRLRYSNAKFSNPDNS